MKTKSPPVTTILLLLFVAMVAMALFSTCSDYYKPTPTPKPATVVPTFTKVPTKIPATATIVPTATITPTAKPTATLAPTKTNPPKPTVTFTPIPTIEDLKGCWLEEMQMWVFYPCQGK